MDPLFVARQPAPPPAPSTIWQNVTISNGGGGGGGGGSGHLQHPDIEYHFANTSHSFTSPPSTPMTPIPHHHIQPGGGGGFHLGHVDPQQHPGSLVLYNLPPTDVPPPPALSHSTWPPEYRLYSLCQELHHYSPQLPESESKAWWDQFMMEYFHDLATLVIEIDFGEGMQRYTLTRNYISWYFKSILLENGVSRYSLLLGGKIAHSFQQQLQRIVCANAIQELDYVAPHQTKVCCQGQLLVDFTIEDKPRIFQWVFHVVNHLELIPRVCLHAASVDSSLSTNLTCNGLPSATQSLLVQLNQVTNTTGIGDNCSQNNHYPDHPSSASWQPSPVIDPPISVHAPTDASNVLSHPPLSAHPMNHSPPPAPLQSTSNSSPVTSPVLNLSINSNGSSCSVSSTSSNQPVPASGSAPVSSHHQPQSGKMINSSASTKKTLVSPSAKKAHHFMVAMEPAYFNEDMVHTEDERLITRVENCIKQTTPTPSVTSTDSENVLTPTHQLTISNKNVPLSWLDITTDSKHCGWGMMPNEPR